MPLRGRPSGMTGRTHCSTGGSDGGAASSTTGAVPPSGSVPVLSSTSTFGRPSWASRARSEPTVRPSRSGSTSTVAGPTRGAAT